MADENEGHVHGSTAGAIDPAAIAVALGGASRSKADAFLDKQNLLADLQIEEIRKQDRLRHWSLRVRHTNDVMKVTFSLAAAAIVTIAAFGIGWMVWKAHEAHGLVVESMRVPPDYAARGLDGTVVSQRLLDKINALVAQSNNFVFGTGSTATASFGDDTKVEIPQTGVSLGELSRELRRWLGNESHITGELWHSKAGIALAVRSDAGSVETAEGHDSDLDALLDKAALALIAQSQPLVYGGLYELKDPRKAEQVYRAEAATASGDERTRAIESLVGVLGLEGRDAEALSIGEPVAAADSDNPGFLVSIANSYLALGHVERAIRIVQRAVTLLDQGTDSLSPKFAAAIEASTRAWQGELSGDFGQAVRYDRETEGYTEWDFSQFGWEETASDEASGHDVLDAKAALARHPGVGTGDMILNELSINYVIPVPAAIDIEEEEWQSLAQELAAADRSALAAGTADNLRHTLVWPWLSYAWAMTGKLADADALIAMTPLDCTLCLVMRGRIAGAKGNYSSAEAWFTRAVADAPSSPFAMADWGAIELRRGKFDSAIARFTRANAIGPHFADPLEFWGEALMLKNRSDLALAKFEEANKYAPNWGRLHLKWGEALFYAGKAEASRSELTKASRLDMSVSDRASLGVWMKQHE